MKKHEEIFRKIKNLLFNHFSDKIEENENGMYIAIKDTGLWISSDPRELTVGYGMTHTHFDPEYDDLNEALELFFNLLTRKKQITKYFKGSFSFKYRIDLILDNEEIYNLGTAMTWLFPYWKTTTIKVEIENEIIELCEIYKEVSEIKTMFNKA